MKVRRDGRDSSKHNELRIDRSTIGYDLETPEGCNLLIMEIAKTTVEAAILELLDQNNSREALLELTLSANLSASSSFC
jgi:hypothetical protein